MPRIVSGSAGSLTLDVPGAGTRPTSDRVREALFSALEARGRVAGARVLDLYAGSGALGLEAASRGAEEVDLVERDQRATIVLRRNATKIGATTGVSASIRVRRAAVRTFLAASHDEWDLVFLDPPYDLADSALAEALNLLAPRLAVGAVVVVERASRSIEPVWPGGVELLERRGYGDTTLYLAEAR